MSITHTVGLSQQTVSQATFNEAIDYLNCKVAELSMKDQPGQPHYAIYIKTTNNCELDPNSESFYTVLKNFLNGRRLGKSQKLAAFINGLKSKYSTTYIATEQYALVIDTLMMTAPIQAFRKNHQTTFPAMQTDVERFVFERFGLATTNVDNSAPIEGEVNNFGDTSDAYINQDGGASNNELSTDTDQINREPDEEYSSNEPSLFEKNRWYILGFLLIGMLGWFWWQRREQLRMNVPNLQLQGNLAAIRGEIDSIKTQIEALKQQGNALQGEVERLRFRVNDFEQHYINTPLLNPPTTTKEKAEAAKEADHSFVIINSNNDNSNANDSSVEDEAILQEVIEDNIISDEDELATNEANFTAVDLVAGTTFYLSIPAENGLFDSREATEVFKRPHSVYEFKIANDNNQKATFQIYDDIATMIRALDNYDEFLRPACRSNAILHKNATKIITSERGTAVYEGGYWRVVRKAVIHYS